MAQGWYMRCFLVEVAYRFDRWLCLCKRFTLKLGVRETGKSPQLFESDPERSRAYRTAAPHHRRPARSCTPDRDQPETLGLTAVDTEEVAALSGGTGVAADGSLASVGNGTQRISHSA